MNERQDLSLPVDSEILTIQKQGEDFFAWVKMDTDKPEQGRTIVICGTGTHVQIKPMKHIATVQADGFVWHFFEE